MNDYLNLLLAYQTLPRIRRRSTFMDISGYPHYENVCSNILKFYLDPQGEHGLRNLLLKAFLRMTGRTQLPAPDEAAIHREYHTKEGKQIDLVIDAESFVLGIENKIYHWEANDFDIYARTLAELGADKELIKVVLCLRTSKSDAPPKGGFVRHTYPELWSHVRDLMGHHLAEADPKWIIYLNEFMATTSRLAGETQDEKQIIDFFIEHQDLISKLIGDRQKILNRCHERLRAIESGLQPVETTKHLSRRWIYLTNCLASHFHILGATIGMDLIVDASGWRLQLFQLPKPTHVLAKIVTSSSIASRAPQPSKEGERYVLQRWDLHASEVELQEALIEWYNALISAADSLTPASVN